MHYYPIDKKITHMYDAHVHGSGYSRSIDRNVHACACMYMFILIKNQTAVYQTHWQTLNSSYSLSLATGTHMHRDRARVLNIVLLKQLFNCMQLAYIIRTGACKSTSIMQQEKKRPGPYSGTFLGLDLNLRLQLIMQTHVPHAPLYRIL